MKSFDKIMQEMLDRVPDDIDKREGSVIYTALAPCAMEIAEQYLDLETVLQLVFASTSRGEFLGKRTAEMGIERMPATYAVKRAVFKDNASKLIDVPVSSRFGIDGLNYTVIKKNTDGTYMAECETAGSDGNVPSGTLLPLEYIGGLATAELSDIITPGTDEETDEKLLARYHLKVREPTTSGNAYHYRKWALEIAGVGDAKVFPLWAGNGTVKVVLLDNSKLPVLDTIIDKVKKHIEEVRPIGATVTVVSARGKAINISASLTLADGFSIETVKAQITKSLTSFLEESAFKSTFVSYAKIGLLILSADGVLDYQSLKINGTTGNIALADEETPVLGGVTIATT